MGYFTGGSDPALGPHDGKTPWLAYVIYAILGAVLLFAVLGGLL